MVRRGQIYFVDLNPVRGREQAGRRPVLVVSDDAINSQPLVITVVVGTDAANLKRDYPINVRLTSRETGLPRDTIFLCFQIRSLDQHRFERLAGTVPPGRMAEIDEALKLVLRLGL